MSVQFEPEWAPEDLERAEMLGILQEILDQAKRDDITRKMRAIAKRERDDPNSEAWVDEQLRKVADDSIWDEVEAQPDPRDFWEWRVRRQ